MRTENIACSNYEIRIESLAKKIGLIFGTRSMPIHQMDQSHLNRIIPTQSKYFLFGLMAIKDAGHGVLNYHGKIFACLLRKKNLDHGKCTERHMLCMAVKLSDRNYLPSGIIPNSTRKRGKRHLASFFQAQAKMISLSLNLWIMSWKLYAP